MGRFIKLFRYLRHLRIKYLFSGSVVVIYGKATIGKGVKIRNSKIRVDEQSSLILGDHCSLDRLLISMVGHIEIGKGNILEQKGLSSPLEIVGHGNLKVGDYNRIRARILIRFGGNVEIGKYTNINEGSEIRSDESVSIGSYNQISYNVMIWDTNTHNIYPAEKRRRLAEDYHPIFGMEIEKPITKPVVIGDDCWLGKNSTVLKGTTLSNKCIVGYGTLLSNTTIEENTTVFLDISTKRHINNI